MLKMHMTRSGILAAAMVIAACDPGIERETVLHPDGSPAFEREYRVLENGTRILHGAQSSWHSSGTRRSLEHFAHGRPSGYAFAWDAQGRLTRMTLCDGTRCRDRDLTRGIPRAAEELARTRFR